MTKKALVVLSGGQDSTTCLAWAVAQGFEVSALTFNYNQRHAIELKAAERVAKLAGVIDHEVVTLGPILKGTSPLTNPDEALETYQDFASMDAIIGDRIETTFVPMRNALFLTIAANRAVVAGINTIITGVCEADNANYPDCRQQFISAQAWTINEALGRNELSEDPNVVKIVTPLIQMTKAQSIALMTSLGSLPWLAFSHTAYDGTYPPVSKDHASVLRAQGFLEAGIPDPLVLRAVSDGLMEMPATENYENQQINESISANIATLAAYLAHKGEHI